MGRSNKVSDSYTLECFIDCGTYCKWVQQPDKASVSKSVRPGKMYGCTYMCQTMEAGVQWIPAQPNPVCHHVEYRVMCPPPSLSKPLTLHSTQAILNSVY